MAFLCGLILLLPFTIAVDLRNPEEIGGFTEGDLVLTEEQREELFHPVDSRNGIRSEKYRWPKKTVLYKISHEFGELEQVNVFTLHE